ncbi:beta-glucoside-specific PTS transporter subunit IIABC [Paenibacillus camerounensis]|uniref:beta-glucoside-specific PTS transporter subunit IIABC n=1 Tax=Paenibacillus camerounensis TaxID=1243663 RepID=UPI00069485D8|nr:beta-glucoside-specific PTS transporter subunit IIABC [Paenibacillus camerounensis]
MMDRKQLAAKIVDNIGGSGNVISAIHCMTRLRFTLKDFDKVNEGTLKSTTGVLGVTKNGGQYQVIIGNDVPLVFSEVAKILPGQTGGAAQAATGNEAPKKKMNPLLAVINVLSSAMAPIVPALAGAGILKVLLSLLLMAGVLKATDQTYYFISFFADSVFYFLPVLLAYSSSKKFNTNPYLSLALGAILLHPNYAALVAAKEPVSLFGLPVTLISYNSTVIPIIITIWLMSYVEKFAEKVSPSVIKVFFKPLLVIIIMAPIAFLAVGPLGYHLGNGLAVGIYFIQEKIGWLALAILGAFKPFIVMTGMHWAFTPAIIQSISQYGYDGLMAVSSLCAIFSLTGVCLAVALRTKDKNLRQISLSAGTTALLSGITEPAIFGVAFKLKRTLIPVIVGGMVSGIYAGLTKLKLFALVSPSLLKFPSFVNEEYPGNLLNAAISAGLALGVSFVLTLIMGLKEEAVPAAAGNAVDGASAIKVQTKQQRFVYSPLNGKTVSLSEVGDNVFSERLMGKGVAIIPSEGKVVSPIAGTVTTLTKTKHAISVTSDEGVEVLIHIGVDTVKLKGRYFTNHVQAGDRVAIGDPLIDFDLAKIAEEGFEVITPIIITNTADYLDVIGNENKQVKQGEEVISIL